MAVVFGILVACYFVVMVSFGWHGVLAAVVHLALLLGAAGMLRWWRR